MFCRTGILVAAHVAGLPGSEECLEPGDLIVSLNGTAVPKVEALRGLLGKLQAGSPVALQIQRVDQLRLVVLAHPRSRRVSRAFLLNAFPSSPLSREIRRTRDGSPPSR